MQPQLSNEKSYKQAVDGLDRLIALIKPSSSTRMKSAVVALFTSDNQSLSLRFSGITGLLHLDHDRKFKTHFFRVYDLQSLTLVLQVQLYYGFNENYTMFNCTLYAFQYLGGVIAFKFRNAIEANIIKITVMNESAKLSDLQQLKQKQRQQKKQFQKKNSMMGKFKSWFHKEEQIKKTSQVVTVVKNKSITFDIETGKFNTQNIPPQWQQIFNNICLTDEELKDNEIAKIIFEETIKHISNQFLIQEANLQHNKNNGQLSNPPKLNLQVPNLTTTNVNLLTLADGRSELMKQIQNNNIKLKPVKTVEKGYELNASCLNKQQRFDLAEHLRAKLEKRRQLLNRRKSIGSQQQN